MTFPPETLWINHPCVHTGVGLEIKTAVPLISFALVGAVAWSGNLVRSELLEGGPTLFMSRGDRFGSQAGRTIVGKRGWVKPTVPAERPMAEKHKARESALDSRIIFESLIVGRVPCV